MTAKKTTKRKTPATKKPVGRTHHQDPVSNMTESAEVTGDADRDYQSPPTHQPGVAVEPGLDPATPPNAN